MQLLNLLKHPSSGDYHSNITTLLTDLGATYQEVCGLASCFLILSGWWLVIYGSVHSTLSFQYCFVTNPPYKIYTGIQCDMDDRQQ